LVFHFGCFFCCGVGFRSGAPVLLMKRPRMSRFFAFWTTNVVQCLLT
jgi:hypothetical protein